MEEKYLTVTPGTIPTSKLHGYLLGATSPRPIAFASTIDKEGTPNLAPFSFFNVFSAKPPILIFSPARRVRNNTTKDTLHNILEVPEVVINVVSHGIVEQMNLASSEYSSDVNEFEKAGFTPVDSELIKPLRVSESPVQMECKVIEVKPLSNQGGAGNLIFCEVLRMHIDRRILDEQGYIDPHKIDLVGRMGGAYYSRASGTGVFKVEKPLAHPGIGIDALPAAIRNSKVLTGNDLGRLGNSASLPGQEVVDDWWKANGEELGNINWKEVQKLASVWLEEGRKDDAFCLLMGAASLRSDA